MYDTSQYRLDASESVWFSRQLESIDQKLYDTVYPDNLARSLIPTQSGVAPWARQYTWRMTKKFGAASIVTNMADDAQRSDVSADESSQLIKTLAAAYGWDMGEIKAAAATNTPLDAMKALSARHSIETLMDKLLATGDTQHNLSGILSLSNTTSFTPSTKAQGGKTWAKGSPDEIASDIFGMLTAVVKAMKASGGAMFQRFRIVLPVEQYSLIAQKRMGDGSDSTILNFVKGNSPYIESINPWHRCAGAGQSSTDRMACFPPSEEVVAAVVPQEFTTMPPEQRNFSYVVNAYATCGGVIARYPVAIAYADGI